MFYSTVKSSPPTPVAPAREPPQHQPRPSPRPSPRHVAPAEPIPVVKPPPSPIRQRAPTSTSVSQKEIPIRQKEIPKSRSYNSKRNVALICSPQISQYYTYEEEAVQLPQVSTTYKKRHI